MPKNVNRPPLPPYWETTWNSYNTTNNGENGDYYTNVPMCKILYNILERIKLYNVHQEARLHSPRLRMVEQYLDNLTEYGLIGKISHNSLPD